ncbi:MAG: TonB-dependent receptor [Caulobacteraceae bacterium]
MVMVVDQPPAAVETVTVNAARLPTSLADAAFSIVKVDPNALQTLPRLDRALETSPGLSLFRRGSSAGANPTTQGVSLRSIGPTAAGRALVTIDGVPQNDPFGNWVIWTSIPTDAIRQISIVRGAGAGPYGAGALTGVIAMDERSQVDGGHFTLGVEGSDLSAWKGSASGSATVADKVQLFGAAQTEKGDRWIPVRQGRGAADTPLTLTDTSATAKAVTDLGFAAFTAEGGAYKESRASGTQFANSSSSGDDAAFTLAAQPDATHLGWRLQTWVRESNLYNTSAAISNSRNTATLSNTQYSTPATGWGANAAVRKLADWGSIEAGADFRSTSGQESELLTYVGGQATKRRVAGGDTQQIGGYVEGAWRSGPWLVTGGMRVDQWQQTNGHRVETTIATGAVTLNPAIANKSGVLPTARGGVRYDIGEGYYVRAAGYEGFRAPSLNELYRPFRVGNNVTEANENLKPEKLYGAELAVGHDQGALTWSATGFVNQLKNPIANVTLGAGPGTFPRAGVVPAGGLFIQRQNLNAINATGVEAEAQYKPIPSLTLALAGDYTEAKVEGGALVPQLTGKRPAETPRLTATAAAEWTVVKDLVFSANVRYEDIRYADDQNTLVLPPGALVGLRLDWQTTPNWGVFLGVDNLADTALATDQTADRTHVYDEPRVFRFGIRFRG